MKANPGGEIAPEDVVGRDGLIETIWRALSRQSLVLVAERRIGKSCVVKKMVAEEPGDVIAIYRDVEGLSSPLEFTERLHQDILAHLTPLRKLSSRAAALLARLRGIEVGGMIKLPEGAASRWKAHLEKALADLSQSQECDVILFWDEFPLMLQKIAAKCGENDAMELLDSLRGARQTRGNIRMVFTGSIGLHHVESRLRDAGHMNDATNDMRTLPIPPLSEADAQRLARMLIEGEGLECPDPERAARSMAASVDCIPYYIHYVAAAMRDRGEPVTAALAEALVAEARVDPQDPWHLRHYRDRLSEYYGKHRLPVVLAILDEVSVSGAPLPLADLMARLKGSAHLGEGETARRIQDGELDELRELLRLLEGDHYLKRNEKGRYVFQFPLIRRWWRIDRGLL